MRDSTITDNTAFVGGGISVAAKNAALTLTGTTICDNLPDDIDGPFTDGGGNSTCTCLGDLDGDGEVGGSDLGAWLVSFGKSCDPEESCPGDFDGDGEVQGSDLGILLMAWGVCP